jgi:hypothetical protein
LPEQHGFSLISSASIGLTTIARDDVRRAGSGEYLPASGDGGGDLQPWNPGSNDTSAAPMSGHVQGWDSLECSLAFRGLLSARSIERDGRADELSLAKIVAGANAFEN